MRRSRRVISVSLTAVAVAAAMTSAHAEQIPVFVFAGQSNAVGYRTDSDQLNAAQKASQPNVLWDGQQDDPVVWTNMSAPTEVNPPGNWPVNSGHGFGPELTAPLTVSNANNSRKVAAVKFAYNASSLAAEWNPNLGAGLYAQMRDQVNEALTKLPQQMPGKTGYVAGFFWMQGESDTDSSSFANAYQNNLTNFIARVRQDLGHPNLPFIIGQINNAGAFTNTVRTAQANVASSVHHTILATTDDLQRVGSDPIHFSTAGTYDLGIRFGNSWNTLVNGGSWAAGSGDWNTGSNWVGMVPDVANASANFLGYITSAATITNNAATTLGSIRFQNSNSYAIAGAGSLTFDVGSGSASIASLQGSHLLNLPVKLNDTTTVSVSAGAALTLGGPLTLSAGTTFRKSGGGTLQINGVIQTLGAATLQFDGGVSKLLATPTVGAMNINSGASVRLDGAGSAALMVNSLGISGGTLDLKSHAALIDYSGASPLQTVRQLIGSAAIAADLPSAAFGLAYAEASALGANAFRGQSVDASAVLIEPALRGDVNFDGIVDITDLGALATNWQAAGVWTSGDSDYNGIVDISDLGMLASNWQQQTSLSDALAALGLPASAVPEPGAVLALLLPGAILSRRR